MGHLIDRTEAQQAVDDAEKLTRTSIGEVVDTNDPQQMGRVRVRCNYFGDNQKKINEIPFATPISPLSGSSSAMPRGRDGNRTVGEVAYGMFNVPKLGSYVLIGCVEGNSEMRIYFGGIHDQYLLHTMPHGRYSYDTANEKLNQDEPSGPFSSSEDPIVPLYDTQTEAFTKSNTPTGQTVPPPRKNYEFRTRGADTGVSGVHETYINASRAGDTITEDSIRTEFTEPDGNTVNFTQGYNVSELQKGLKSTFTGDYVYDSQMYSWTTPGFHSISMSDNPDNCRIRFRSTQGHQIIMDDTNERIYISTAGGKTWIEMDEAGNIDIYGERNVSVHAEKDINFTAGDTFRVNAKNGIHMISEGEMRLHTVNGKMHIKSGDTTEFNNIGDLSISAPNMFLTADTAVHIKASGGVLNLQSGAATNVNSGAALNLQSVAALSVNSGAALNLQSGAVMNLLSSGDILQTGASIHLNGPGAGSAASAASATDTVPANTFEAWWTNRVPEHEPWARQMTKKDADKDAANSWDMEYANYDDPNIGRMERGDDLGRNPKWHR